MRKKLTFLRFTTYISGLFIAYSIPLSYIEGRSLCILYNLFNTECIGCGTTRAVFNMMHFNFEKAFNYNKLAFLWVAVFLIILINDIVIGIRVICGSEECRYSVVERFFTLIIDSFKGLFNFKDREFKKQ